MERYSEQKGWNERFAQHCTTCAYGAAAPKTDTSRDTARGSSVGQCSAVGSTFIFQLCPLRLRDPHSCPAFPASCWHPHLFIIQMLGGQLVWILDTQSSLDTTDERRGKACQLSCLYISVTHPGSRYKYRCCCRVYFYASSRICP